MMDRRTAVFGLIAAFAALSPTESVGQNVRVGNVPSTVMVGEEFNVTLKVAYRRNVTQPQPPETPGILIQGPRSQYTRINNSQTQSYVFSVVPLTEGAFEFPALEFEVDGQSVRSEAQPFTVVPNELATATLTTRENRLFVGQRADFILTLKLAAPGPPNHALNWSEAAQFLQTPRDFPRLSFVRTTREETTGGLRTFHEYQAALTLDLTEPGYPSIVSITPQYRFAASFRRDIFGSLQPVESRDFLLVPRLDTPTVESLPIGGRPADFTGAVGRYAIRTSAAPRRVSVGAPITLRLEITGDGPIELLPGPDLSKQAALNADFRVPTEALAGETDGRARRYSQAIRPRDADVKEIPPIEFSYFDPSSAEYRVARSEPIRIEVAPADEFDVTDMKITLPSETDLGAVDGLRGPRVEESELLVSHTEVTPTMLAIAAAAPPALFVCAWLALLGRGREGNAQSRRRSALRNAERRLAEIGANGRDHHAREIVSVVADYLADRLSQPAGRFVGAEAAEAVRRVSGSPELAQRFEQLLSRCEASAFGGAESDAELIEAARAALRDLEAQRG
ncbi:MAG: BatD family protein [Phycisphaerales bacterium]|nr:BatD family protein [Phycisphaerales bacterium]